MTITSNAISNAAVLTTTSLDVRTGILSAKVTVPTRPVQYLTLTFAEVDLLATANAAVPPRADWNTGDVRTLIAHTLASTEIS